MTGMQISHTKLFSALAHSTADDFPKQVRFWIKRFENGIPENTIKHAFLAAVTKSAQTCPPAVLQQVLSDLSQNTSEAVRLVSVEIKHLLKDKNLDAVPAQYAPTLEFCSF